MSSQQNEIHQVQEKLVQYILETQWEDFPIHVQERAVTCSVDLFDVVVSGSQTLSAESGRALAESLYPSGAIPVVGAKKVYSYMGAVTAYAYIVNALDIDDGYNMIKGHPGAVIMGALLPAALATQASYKEFLTALVVAYEVSMRGALAMQDYYQFYHGSGSWGAFGIAAGIGRLFKMNAKDLSTALSIADFHGPLTPVMRSVERPSMNKDGIPMGVIMGALAVEAAKNGITGDFYTLLEPQYHSYIESLGKEYLIMDLYFKWFPCCRWAHPSVSAGMELKTRYDIAVDQIERINIKTFKAAATLSTMKPTLTDEAQYNIVYPLCAALAEGKLTPVETSEGYLSSHPQVIDLIDKVFFEVEPEFEEKFPRKRFAKVEIITKDGKRYISEPKEPIGEQEDNVDFNWVKEKFLTICAHCMPKDAIIELVNDLKDVENRKSLNDIVNTINTSINK